MANELTVKNGQINLSKDFECIAENEDGGLQLFDELERLIRYRLDLSKLDYNTIITYLKRYGSFLTFDGKSKIEDPIHVKGWQNFYIAEYKTNNKAPTNLRTLTGGDCYLAIDSNDRIYSTNDLEWLYTNLTNIKVFGSVFWTYSMDTGWHIEDFGTEYHVFENLDDLCNKIVDTTGIKNFIVGDPIAFHRKYKAIEAVEILRTEYDQGINTKNLPIIWYDWHNIKIEECKAKDRSD